jgi:hypoxanthine phosphoribosyltransferase
MSADRGVRPGQVLFTADQIRDRVAALALAIRRDVPEDLHLVGVLKGAFMFVSDLIRRIDGGVSVDFLAVSTYATGKSSSGDVRLLKDLEIPLTDKNVVIVEDIVDSGLTLSYLQNMLRARGPRTLRSACLLSKPSRRTLPVAIDYVGFEVPDCFVVGYGLDCAEQYRNLPYIATAGEEIV